MPSGMVVAANVMVTPSPVPRRQSTARLSRMVLVGIGSSDVDAVGLGSSGVDELHALRAMVMVRVTARNLMMAVPAWVLPVSTIFSAGSSNCRRPSINAHKGDHSERYHLLQPAATLPHIDRTLGAQRVVQLPEVLSSHAN